MTVIPGHSQHAPHVLDIAKADHPFQLDARHRDDEGLGASGQDQAIVCGLGAVVCDHAAPAPVDVHNRLARVEGEGGITIRTEGKKIKDVQFDILEGTRLVEALVVGKTPEEDVSITCRICAICTLSHRYAALRGLEKALGIQVPPKVQWLQKPFL